MLLLSSVWAFLKRRRAEVLFFTSTGTLIFAYGAIVGYYHVFPYSVLRSVLMSAAQQARDLTDAADTVRFNHHKIWNEQAEPGVTVLDANAIYPGPTLLAGFRGEHFLPFLVDGNGDMIHEWDIAFSQIWEDPQHERFRLSDSQVAIHGLHLFPNGEIVMNFEYRGTVRIDHCARVLWTYDAETHHAVTVEDDGTIWVLSRELVEAPRPELPHLEVPYFDDTVVHLDTSGQPIEEFSILEALFDGGYAGIVLAGPPSRPSLAERDPLHANDVEIVGPALAQRSEAWTTGDLLLSLRTINTIAVVDRSTKRAVWAMRGPFLRQHDPDVLPNGTLMVYDNRTAERLKPPLATLTAPQDFGFSRIVEFDPLSGQTLWVFTGSDAFPFYSSIQGKQQSLPNGNVLVVDPEGGRVFELARGRPDPVVWQYVNTLESSPGYVGRVTEAHRVDDGDALVGKLRCD